MAVVLITIVGKFTALASGGRTVFFGCLAPINILTHKPADYASESARINKNLLL